MKNLVVILMIISLMVLLGVNILAQGTTGIDAKLVNQAGHQLEDYTSQYDMGLEFQAVGGVLTILGVYYSNPLLSPALVLLGSITDFVGSVIQNSAVDDIKAAGKSLVLATNGQ